MQTPCAWPWCIAGTATKKPTGRGRAGRRPGRSSGSRGRGRNRDELDDAGSGREPSDSLPQAVHAGAKEELDEIQPSGSGSGVVVVPGSDSEPEAPASPNVLVSEQASERVLVSGHDCPPPAKSTGSREEVVERSHQDSTMPCVCCLLGLKHLRSCSVC